MTTRLQRSISQHENTNDRAPLALTPTLFTVGCSLRPKRRSVLNSSCHDRKQLKQPDGQKGFILDFVILVQSGELIYYSARKSW